MNINDYFNLIWDQFQIKEYVFYDQQTDKIEVYDNQLVGLLPFMIYIGEL